MNHEFKSSNIFLFFLIDRWLLKTLHKSLGYPGLRLTLGQREILPPSNSQRSTTVNIATRRVLAGLALNPEMEFGDAYSEGQIEVDGDLEELLEVVLKSMARVRPRSTRSKWVSRWLDRAHANTLNGAHHNIHHHYDLTVDFYKLWLDSQLVYTCGYFPTTSATLEQAQLAKMDHICRKLQLNSGDHVVEAGCGWGALALHMAKNYGAKVRAFNISGEQVRIARERAKKEGLESLVEFVEEDFRNISGHYDVFVSVGMLEHIGPENYRDLGRIVHQSVGSSGRGLLHFIGRNCPRPFSPWIRKRIFPGAYIPSLSEAMAVLEFQDFSVLDVENLRGHYARTLEVWLDRFEDSWDPIVKMFGIKFARIWRLYLAGSIAAFRVGNLQLFQVVFAGRECQTTPWTRAYLYAGRHVESKENKWTHVMS